MYRTGIVSKSINVRLVFADFANSQKTVAWVFGNFVTSWKLSWFALATFYLSEKVDSLVFATAQGNVFFVQEVFYSFRVRMFVSCHSLIFPPFSTYSF